MKFDSQASTLSNQINIALDIGSIFWQQWQLYQDYLYRCCVKWMGGNPIDAEDALSRAMLKAWKKVQKYAGEITNFKAWLVTLTRNLCVDIHRERSRGANRVEDIEIYAAAEEQGLFAVENTPESAVENSERKMVIRRAIDNLPTRLRETFILHFYQELSYPEIAEQQDISYQNVCKRISQARKILQAELKGYFIGEEGTDRDKSVTPTVTESEIGEISEGNGGVEARAGEMVLAVAVEEVEIVGTEESPGVVQSMHIYRELIPARCFSTCLSSEEINSEKKGRSVQQLYTLEVRKMKRIPHIITAIMAAIAITFLTILPANAQQILDIASGSVVTKTFNVTKCFTLDSSQTANLKFLDGVTLLRQYVVGEYPTQVVSTGVNRIANDGPNNARCQ
jgi:RNA polymerase sigma-70 factor (ECF subfamily)